jgi:FtsZ-interacting cell division protein ZipA
MKTKSIIILILAGLLVISLWHNRKQKQFNKQLICTVHSFSNELDSIYFENDRLKAKYSHECDISDSLFEITDNITGHFKAIE